LLESLVASSNFDEHSAIKLLSALKEGMDNAMRHGNQGDANKSVEVIYLQRMDRAEVHIIDEGSGFDWSSYLERAQGGDAYQLARDNRKAGKRGGLGIKIMFECSDRMRYHGNGHHLELHKNL
jgi:anti-sigma regulatory factor (Ser/Thr protein kinase)